MSKLFRLKEWLTVADAARHLSIAFGEEVSEPDVLRLALDGHLKLSVNFVNHASARRGKVIPWEETEWKMFPKFDFGTKPDVASSSSDTAPPTPEEILECPPNLLAAWNEIPEADRNNFSPLLTCLNIDSKRFLNLNHKVVSIADVWDLPMIGSERLDVEHLYQQLTGGPEVTLTGMDGAFVEKDGVMCQLQEDFDENEYCACSKAQLRKLEARIALNKIKGAEAQKLLDKHKQDRKVFLENRASKDKSNGYYPAGGLPKDSVLVVRTSALREFEQAVNNTPTSTDKPITTTERNTLLTIIAALCDYSAIDPTGRGTAGQIEKMSEELGAPVTDDTIRKVLAKIPDALESRKK